MSVRLFIFPSHGVFSLFSIYAFECFSVVFRHSLLTVILIMKLLLYVFFLSCLNIICHALRMCRYCLIIGTVVLPGDCMHVNVTLSQFLSIEYFFLTPDKQRCYTKLRFSIDLLQLFQLEQELMWIKIIHVIGIKQKYLSGKKPMTDTKR